MPGYGEGWVIVVLSTSCEKMVDFAETQEMAAAIKSSATVINTKKVQSCFTRGVASVVVFSASPMTASFDKHIMVGRASIGNDPNLNC